MDFFSRLSLGYELAKNSLKVLKENKQLILFPILSGVTMLLILASLFISVAASYNWDMEQVPDFIAGENAPVMILFYLICYFIVIFFNTALIHCTHLYFIGEKPTIAAGLKFSLSRIGVILGWAIFSSTVGYLLRLIQENTGLLGKLITAAIGIVWNIATFFVLPVIAYENVGPIDAVKRSSTLMKEKWGESLGMAFSFGILRFIGCLIIGLVFFLVGYFIHPIPGIALGVLAILLLLVVLNAAETIFISAVYHDVKGDPVKHFNEQFTDNLFTGKKD